MVDENDRLVGVITFDDIVDVIEEEAEEDIKALGGVRREEELSDPVWTIARGRFNWLLVNLATAFLAVGFAVSVDVLLTEQWDTHQPIFSASSTMIPAGPRT